MQNSQYKFKPSKIYCAFLIAAVLASLIIVISVSANIWIKLGLLLLLAVYGGYTIFHYGFLRANFSIIALSYAHDNVWTVTTNQGGCEAPVRGDSTVTPLVCILRFDIPEQKMPVSCIVFKDSLAKDAYRRLVAQLRMS